jgi:hypothetical protein
MRRIHKMQILTTSGKYSGKSIEHLTDLIRESASSARGVLLYMMSSESTSRQDIGKALTASYQAKRHQYAETLLLMIRLIGRIRDEIQGDSELLKVFAGIIGSASPEHLKNAMQTAPNIASYTDGGLIDAILFMTEGTPQEVINKMVDSYGLRRDSYGDSLAQRQRFLLSMRSADGKGIPWNNNYSGMTVAALGVGEGWGNGFIKSVINDLESFPESFVTAVLAEAPSSMSSVMMLKNFNLQTAESVIALLEEFFNQNDSNSAAKVAIDFTKNKAIPLSERAEVLSFLAGYSNLEKVYKKICKSFASSRDASEWNYARKMMDEGYDGVVEEVTGNLNFSIDLWSDIYQSLKEHDFIALADPQFLQIVKAVSGDDDVDDGGIDFLDDDDYLTSSWYDKSRAQKRG